MEEKLSIAEILNELKELKIKLETMFNEKNSDKTRVLLLGPTGVGKTTFMHLIAGCNITAEKISENHNVVLNCKENCKANNIKIGHTKNAETTLPSLLHISDVLFCDCPGLLDKRSIQQRILNAFSLDHILTSPCKIKILLILSEDNFEATRGDSAIGLMDEAEKFFTDYEQIFLDCLIKVFFIFPKKLLKFLFYCSHSTFLTEKSIFVTVNVKKFENICEKYVSRIVK